MPGSLTSQATRGTIMLSEPSLTHEEICAAVAQHWSRQATALHFLMPGGECSWSYRLDSDAGERYFLKLSQPGVCGTALCEQNLVAAAELAQAPGGERIITAMLARSGRYLESIGPYQARLQPWVEGQAFMDLSGGPDDAAQRQLGELVAEIHSFTPQQRPTPEQYAAAELRDWPPLQAALAAPPSSWSAEQRALADLVRASRPHMVRWIDEYQVIEQRVLAARHTPVFCHGDPSSGNAMLRPNGQLVLIDLDAPAWAPRERDLFHLRLWPAALQGYRSRFPDYVHDPDLLRLYQLAWDIGEVVAFGWRALMTRQSVMQQRHDLRELRKHLEDAT